MYTFVLIICVIFRSITFVLGDGSVTYKDGDVERLFLKEVQKPEYCRYRNELYPKPFFKEVAGFYCYSYGSLERFKTEPYKAFGKWITYDFDHKSYSIPYSRYAEEAFFYDYQNNVFRTFIADSFASSKYFDKWLECAKNADICCQTKMTNENIADDEGFCPLVWDAWNCFPETDPGSVAEKPCPNYAYISDPPCIQNSQKTCFKNGTWKDKTDYETCQFVSNVRNRHLFHVFTLYVSIAVCLPAIIIFFCYPALRIMRVILHRNLLIAIIFKNIFIILSKILITIDAMDAKKAESVLAQNGIPCRVLAFFERVSINAVYACMLIDGFYLHKIIVRAFRKDPSIYLLYGVIFVLSLVPILIWAVFKAIDDNIYCWVVDESWRQWIIDGSRYAMLGINLILLLDIIRVLYWKLKRNNNRAQHTRSTLRATFILLPLFGIQFIMMSQRPVNATCFWDDVFYYISYGFESSQGILVSLLYCYFNNEVQTQLRKSYLKIRNELAYKFGGNRRRQTDLRRTTAATYVPDNPRRSVFQPRPSVMNKIAEEPSNEQVNNWLQQNVPHRTDNPSIFTVT